MLFSINTNISMYKLILK